MLSSPWSGLTPMVRRLYRYTLLLTWNTIRNQFSTMPIFKSWNGNVCGLNGFVHIPGVKGHTNCTVRFGGNNRIRNPRCWFCCWMFLDYILRYHFFDLFFHSVLRVIRNWSSWRGNCFNARACM